VGINCYWGILVQNGDESRINYCINSSLKFRTSSCSTRVYSTNKEQINADIAAEEAELETTIRCK
jgi:LEA14-like dessication related protein